MSGQQEEVGRIVITLREKGIKGITITGRISPQVINSLKFNIQQAYRKHMMLRSAEGRKKKVDRDRKKALELQEAAKDTAKIEAAKVAREQKFQEGLAKLELEVTSLESVVTATMKPELRADHMKKVKEAKASLAKYKREG